MRGISVKQRIALASVANGHVSSNTERRLGPLVKRGLVTDLGLYDRVNHTKRYGHDRYKISEEGRKCLSS